VEEEEEEEGREGARERLLPFLRLCRCLPSRAILRFRLLTRWEEEEEGGVYEEEEEEEGREVEVAAVVGATVPSEALPHRSSRLAGSCRCSCSSSSSSSSRRRRSSSSSSSSSSRREEEEEEEERRAEARSLCPLQLQRPYVALLLVSPLALLPSPPPPPPVFFLLLHYLSSRSRRRKRKRGRERWKGTSNKFSSLMTRTRTRKGWREG